MRKTKEEKGVSRRMFCKLVSTGAVAIGSSCLMPSPSVRIGDVGFLGVQAAEAMTTVNMNEVSKESNAGPLFTGPDVTRQSLISDSKPRCCIKM